MSKLNLIESLKDQFVAMYLTDCTAYYGYIGKIVDNTWVEFYPISHRDDEQKYQATSTRLFLVDSISSFLTQGKEFDKIRLEANFTNFEYQIKKKEETQLETFMNGLDAWMADLDNRMTVYKKDVAVEE